MDKINIDKDKFIKDYQYRTMIFTTFFGLINLILFIWYLVRAIQTSSFWYGETSLYYFLLFIGKLVILILYMLFRNKEEKERIKLEEISTLVVGIDIILISIFCAGFTVYFSFQKALLTYLDNALFFVTIIISGIKIIIVLISISNRFKKYRDVKSPLINSIKYLSIVEFIITLAVVTTSLIYYFNGKNNIINVVVNTIPVSLLVFGILLIVNFFKKEK